MDSIGINNIIQVRCSSLNSSLEVSECLEIDTTSILSFGTSSRAGVIIKTVEIIFQGFDWQSVAGINLSGRINLNWIYFMVHNKFIARNQLENGWLAHSSSWWDAKKKCCGCWVQIQQQNAAFIGELIWHLSPDPIRNDIYNRKRDTSCPAPQLLKSRDYMCPNVHVNPFYCTPPFTAASKGVSGDIM